MAAREKGTTDRIDVRECCKYLGALAEPERLRIVQSLLDGPKSVGEVCRLLDSPLANTSHHLKQLRAAGLVEGVKRGRFVVYSLAPEVLRQSAAKGEDPAKLVRDVLDFGCCQLDLGQRPIEARVARGKPTA